MSINTDDGSILEIGFGSNSIFCHGICEYRENNVLKEDYFNVRLSQKAEYFGEDYYGIRVITGFFKMKVMALLTAECERRGIEFIRVISASQDNGTC